MADASGVLIGAECTEGKLAAITTELLGCGRRLADDLGEQVSAALLGNGVQALAGEALAFGADRVYVADDPALEDYEGEAYTPAMEQVIAEANPRIVLLGQTSMGRDLAPRLAFRLKTALSMDCVELDIDPETQRLLQIRPVYGGNVRGVFVSDEHPQMATVRAKTMSPAERDMSRNGEVIEVSVRVDPARVRTRVVQRVKEDVAGVKLEDAPTVVTGGRGVGGPEGFEQLAELAKLLKGAVGATRPVIDSGWVPSTAQIGLTGKVVAPDVYFAVALSGSTQHMAGCSGSKHIIAINRDPEANVFDEAEFGIVGDWKKALPAFVEKVRELLEE
jgi:electron transfer flavoprotein alpha subunit